ncbi:hypothetical protein AVEN_111514-1 [Araneus ventricosus]|uniref:Uncharacterized protein n=1 Tax=Araneus ventricosus TaxID=182803 RepID=A0A4Y2W0W9_ARAVE|nr:hypothetical protein AVEN_19116-1 [Araneus ventricosus]GBO30209.1 hypothetical protein AVEN_111514-1 [Araneus ventricosus]
MKQFIKSLPKDGVCFRYLCSNLPKLSEASWKREFLLSRRTKTVPLLENDFLFSETMEDNEKEARDSFKDVVHRFWENTKDPLYKTIVQRLLTAYEAQGC